MANIILGGSFAPGLVRKVLQPDILPNIIFTLTFASQTQPIGDQAIEVALYRKPYTQDFYLSGTNTRGIPSPPPFIQGFALPNPERKPYQQLEQVPSLPVSILPKFGQVFRLPLFTDVARPANTRDYLTFESVVYLPASVAPPFLPADLPTPMPAKRTPQDFSWQTLSLPPLPPFSQSDWPLHLRARSLLQDHTQGAIQNLGIPPATVLPFNQYEWPLFRRKDERYGESYSSPHSLIVLKPPPPFFQTEWVTPLKARITPQDWPWSGTTTQGIPPVVVPVFGPGLNACNPMWSADGNFQITSDGYPGWSADGYKPTPLQCAVQSLASFSINVGTLTYSYSIAPIGWVVTGYVPDETAALSGQYLPLTISNGPQPGITQTVVPNVVGDYYYDAQLAILDASLLIAPPVWVLAPNVIPGYVVSQSLVAGISVNAQTQMTITVSGIPVVDQPGVVVAVS